MTNRTEIYHDAGVNMAWEKFERLHLDMERS